MNFLLANSQADTLNVNPPKLPIRFGWFTFGLDCVRVVYIGLDCLRVKNGYLHACLHACRSQKQKPAKAAAAANSDRADLDSNWRDHAKEPSKEKEQSMSWRGAGGGGGGGDSNCSSGASSTTSSGGRKNKKQHRKIDAQSDIPGFGYMVFGYMVFLASFRLYGQWSIRF